MRIRATWQYDFSHSLCKNVNNGRVSLYGPSTKRTGSPFASSFKNILRREKVETVFIIIHPIKWKEKPLMVLKLMVQEIPETNSVNAGTVTSTETFIRSRITFPIT